MSLSNYDTQSQLATGHCIERTGRRWAFKKGVSLRVIDDSRRDELHYLVLATGKCIAVILNNGNNWSQAETNFRVKETVEVDNQTLPVVGIWLTYTDTSYNKTPDNVSVIIPKTVEYVLPVISGNSEHLKVRFEVDGNNPHLSSGEDGCLYDKQQTRLLHFGGDPERWIAPETLVTMSPEAFHGVTVRKLVFTPAFTRLGKEWNSARCSNLDFQGQLTHIDAEALDNVNGTVRMNGWLSQLDEEGQQALKEWHDGRNTRERRYRDLVLASPATANGSCENGVITLTQVFDLDRKLHECRDCGTIQLNVNVNTALCEAVGAGIPILIDTVKIDKEKGYDSRSYHIEPLYEDAWVTRIRLVPLVKPQEPQILEILVHEPEDDVKALLQQAYN